MPHRSVSSGGALVSGLVVSNRPGSHISTHITVDPTLPSGTYYLHLIQAAAIPANGAVTFLHAPVVVVHVFGIPDDVNVDDGEGGVAFQNGLCVVLSTTQFTLTRGGSFLMIDSEIDA